METATKTESKTATIVTSSAKLVKLIVSEINAAIKAQQARVALAQGIQEEAARNGYDRDQAQQMVKFSYRDANRETLAELRKQHNGDEKAALAALDELYKSRVSTVMVLAYPKTDAAAAEVAKGIALNKKAGKSVIGENKLIEVARGNLTVADALAGKKPTRNVTTSSTLPLSEQIGNAIAGLFAKFDVKDEGKLNEFISAAEKAFAIKRESFTKSAK